MSAKVFLSGFGRSRFAPGEIVSPRSDKEISSLFERARREGRRVVLRGAGYSYGDAAIGEDALVLDTSGMDRILSWDPTAGILEAEPGLSIRNLILWVISDGWFPAVVPGSSFPTLGGCVSSNVHGKNAVRQGTFGEHIDEIEAILPTGARAVLSPKKDADAFRAFVGGMGLLGATTRIRLRLRRIESGLIEAVPRAARNLAEAFGIFEESSVEHLVGWLDAHARGSSLGRGILHLGHELELGEDPNPRASLRPEAQKIPSYPLARAVGAGLRAISFVNAAKFRLDSLGAGRARRESLVSFHFLLDRIPGWNLAYPHGFIQYQPFAPRVKAEEIFGEILETLQAARRVPTLAVMKRHRPDPFLLSPSLDGYSLALDIPLARPREEGGLADLAAHLAPLDEKVAAAGGRFYLAKDATLGPVPFAASLGSALGAFRAAKRTADPAGILTSALAERLEIVGR